MSVLIRDSFEKILNFAFTNFGLGIDGLKFGDYLRQVTVVLGAISVYQEWLLLSCKYLDLQIRSAV